MTNLREVRAKCARFVSTLLLLVALGLGSGFVFAAPATAADEGRLTVLIGTSGVTWLDVSVSTPNLLLTADWPAGSLAARSVGPYSCPADGWLAISTGTRARSSVHGAAGCPADMGSFDHAVARAERDSYGSVPGMFGQALADAGVRSSGIGEGAKLALADRRGEPVGRWQSRRERLGEQVRAAVLDLGAAPDRPGLLVIDLGSVNSPDAPSPSRGMTDVDARFGQVLAELPTDAQVLFASLSDGTTAPHLQSIAYRTGRGSDTDLLMSDSTRQPGYVVATDVAPTLLSAVGVPVPSAMVGAPIRGEPSSSASSSRRLVQLRDPDLAAQQVHTVVPYFVILTYLPVLILLVWTWWRSSRSDPTSGWPTWLRPLCTFLAMVPAATFLANLYPWWRSRVPFVAVEAAVLAIAAVLTIPVAFALPRLPRGLRPWVLLGWPGVVTFVVFGLDLLKGSRLQVSSLIGLQPLEAGRFYGLGNPQFALFATSAILIAGAVAGFLLTRWPTSPQDHWSRPRRIAAASVLTVAVFALAFDATPGLGSDFGGPPALIPAMLGLTTLVLGFAVTWRRVLVAAGATGAFSVIVCVLDWLRPAQQRTHLGRFVQTILDGQLGPVLRRKLSTNFEILVSTPYTLLIPVVAAFAAWYLLRPVPQTLKRTYERAPIIRHILMAWFVMVAIAFLLNDSGVVVPPVAGLLMAPALLAFLPWPSAAGPHRSPVARQDSGTTAPRA